MRLLPTRTTPPSSTRSGGSVELSGSELFSVDMCFHHFLLTDDCVMPRNRSPTALSGNLRHYTVMRLLPSSGSGERGVLTPGKFRALTRPPRQNDSLPPARVA